MRNPFSGHAGSVLIALAATALGVAVPLALPLTAAQSFQDVLAPNPADYSGYQIKLTYTGLQEKVVPSLLLVGDTRTAAPDEFEPYESPGVRYGNDDVSLITLDVAGTTIRRFVEQGIGTRPELQDDSEGEPFLSIMIQRGADPNDVVWESKTQGLDTRLLVTLLRAAAQPESLEVRETVRKFRNWVVGT